MRNNLHEMQKIQQFSKKMIKESLRVLKNKSIKQLNKDDKTFVSDFL